MAYVIIEENLHDQAFLDAFTVGFSMFKDYVLGVEDGLPKTPFWAEGITGVPSGVIITLAREYATTKPAALIAGIAPGRTAYGEQYHRAAITLAAMTGNIGIHGGSAAGRAYAGMLTGGEYPYVKLGNGISTGDNPVEYRVPLRKGALPGRNRLGSASGRIHCSKIADAILKGKAGGYPANYKLLYLMNTHYPNQFLNVNKP